MSQSEEMTNYLQHFIEGIISIGMNYVVISPGSRSTPLAVLLHRQKAIETFISIDERSAAFFALGLSKATKKPVGLLCTSGTAAANYYPAICEAKASQTPLVVLTTDRPHELRQVGAPQTMNQLNLFQDHVKLFIEMAIPEASKEMLTYAYWQGMRATATANQIPRGPVHLNFPLREPLLPSRKMNVSVKQTTQIIAGKQQLSEEQIQQCAREWQGKKGLFVIGGSHSPKEARHWIALAEALNWPIISDPLSNILSSGQPSRLIMSHVDLFIQEIALTTIKPEVIVRVRNVPLSKNTSHWLQTLSKKEIPIYFIDETGEWHDHLRQSHVAIQTNEQLFIQALIKKIKQKSSESWINQWLHFQKITEKELVKSLELSQLNELSASILVHKMMETNGRLFISNSNAVRFFDRFAAVGATTYSLFGNRGVNGIDGIVSTALGMCASSPKHQNILLIGDLALYHDMNGLLMAKQYHLPLTIVLLNNNGGGIFSFLTQQQLPKEEFESLFGTPLDLDFSLVANLYGADYTKVQSLEQLQAILTDTQPTPTFQIIEIDGNRQENVEIYEKIRKKIRKEIRKNK